MPESEPKPKLIELVAPGAGQGWKAVLKNGKAVVVHEIPVPAAEAAAAVPRLQRLAEHRHPALSPVLAWGTDPNGIWVAVEPNEGVPLGSILSRGPLTPPAAAALGAAVLSGVAALHEAGIAMGGFSASAVRITSNGDVRLAGHPAAAVRGAPSQSDLRADVRSSGMAVCSAFGVDPAGAPAPPNIPPGLVVTMRSMASGAMGPAADRAQGALREMASALLAPDRQIAAQSELALRAGGREMPSITPFLPKEEPAPAPAPIQPWGAAPTQPPAPAAQAPAPAPYVPPPREDTPIRAPASYDAPERPVQTYPSLPAIPVPPPTAPVPAPERPPGPSSAVPTWEEAPPRPSAPHAVPPSPMDTNPPAAAPPATPPAAPAPEPPPPAPAPYEAPPAPPYQPPAPARWEPAAPSSPFDTIPPGGARATNPPAPATPAPPPQAPAPPVPAPSSPPAWTPAPTAPTPSPASETKAPEQQTWSPVAAPLWTPGTDVQPSASSTAPPSAPSSPPAPATFPPSPVRAPARKPSTVPRRPADRGPIERPPWLVPAVIAVVVILLLGTVGAILLHGRGGGTGGTAQASPSVKPSSKPTASPSPTAISGPLPVPSFGPTSAAPITSVVICSTETPCRVPGSASETNTACDLTSCHVEVGLYFSSAQRVPISYVMQFFDRCTGTTTQLPGPKPYTPPGYAIVIPSDRWPVSIPSGVKSGALVAVAQTPVVAASAPLLLGASTC